MKKKKQWNFWGLVARFILRNRILILLALISSTIFWSTQWKFMQFTYTEANLLPDQHPENIIYKSFTNIFGEEGNVLVIAFQENEFYIPNKRNTWKDLNKIIEELKKLVLSYQLKTSKILKRIKKIGVLFSKRFQNNFPLMQKILKNSKKNFF